MELQNISFLNEAQKGFLEFVQKAHGNQKRKYTNEPYVYHLINVARNCAIYSSRTGIIEIALGHDLLEDTKVSQDEILKKLLELGYSDLLAILIVRGIKQLTDHYTPEAYPDLNREKRKHKEALRLAETDEIAQIVKCYDMIDNTISIVKFDPKFAEVYLKEKEEMLNHLYKAETGTKLIAQVCLVNAQVYLIYSQNKAENHEK